MPRQARLEAPEVLQHVMARGIERRKIFFDAKDYQFFKDRLGKLVLETRMDCLAWALLPNHFHLLLRTHQIPLSLFMRRLMTAYAGYFNRRHHLPHIPSVRDQIKNTNHSYEIRKTGRWRLHLHA
jgi:putative transposase